MKSAFFQSLLEDLQLSEEYRLLGYRGYATSVYQQEAEVGAGHGFYLGLMQMGAFFVGKPSCFALNC
jgi:hypothetical protein